MARPSVGVLFRDASRTWGWARDRQHQPSLCAIHRTAEEGEQEKKASLDGKGRLIRQCEGGTSIGHRLLLSWVSEWVDLTLGSQQSRRALRQAQHGPSCRAVSKQTNRKKKVPGVCRPKRDMNTGTWASFGGDREKVGPRGVSQGWTGPGQRPIRQREAAFAGIMW